MTPEGSRTTEADREAINRFMAAHPDEPCGVRGDCEDPVTGGVVGTTPGDTLVVCFTCDAHAGEVSAMQP